MTESAEAQVAEAWAAVEEQASVAAHAVRKSALHVASSETHVKRSWQDFPERALRSSPVARNSESTTSTQFSATQHPRHHSKLSVDPVSINRSDSQMFRFDVCVCARARACAWERSGNVVQFPAHTNPRKFLRNLADADSRSSTGPCAGAQFVA